jgi:hypothetical protein
MQDKNEYEKNRMACESGSVWGVQVFSFFLLCRKQGQIVKSADSTRKFLRFLPWGQKRVKGSPDPINGSIWHRRSRLEYGREMNS